MSEENIKEIVEKSKGYSCADITNLCAEASMIPIRDHSDIRNISLENIRAICCNDFIKALQLVRSSVSPKDLDFYEDWNETFGSFTFKKEDLDN